MGYMEIRCSSCGGAGQIVQRGRCPVCDGKGRRTDRLTGREEACSACTGGVATRTVRCSSCMGTGRIKVTTGS